MKKLCVLFPGIGYHCDKPLLYYSAKAAAAKGYDVIRLKFDGFEKGAFGNEEKIKKCAEHAYSQSAIQLEDTAFDKYEKIVFIGKSIGTYAALKYKKEKCVGAECILLTPLLQSLEYSSSGEPAFHGTNDPWVNTDELKAQCRMCEIPVMVFENANHSLETGDTSRDIEILKSVIEEVNRIL